MELNPKILSTVLSGAALAAAIFFVPFEGDSLKTYSDPPGISTDCIGHTKGVKAGAVETPANCLKFLGQDTNEAAAEVRQTIKIKLPEKTEAAFISFTFNEGAGTFRHSSIARDANAGRLAAACNDMAACEYSKKAGQYVGFGCGWAGGKRLPGLERRRFGEKALCLEGLNE